MYSEETKSTRRHSMRRRELKRQTSMTQMELLETRPLVKKMSKKLDSEPSES